ncbi:unnamed protein product [Pleuronectes platessa]|uniref:Uncharacterized protein n=1 Tax=Pleuronectes platessa TaxID=8262 RepID=A0A9N7YH95_PLEPL|nr:unnamed protein product [Pleuronectes platessa]
MNTMFKNDRGFWGEDEMKLTQVQVTEKRKGRTTDNELQARQVLTVNLVLASRKQGKHLSECKGTQQQQQQQLRGSVARVQPSVSTYCSSITAVSKQSHERVGGAWRLRWLKELEGDARMSQWAHDWAVRGTRCSGCLAHSSSHHPAPPVFIIDYWFQCRVHTMKAALLLLTLEPTASGCACSSLPCTN